MKILYSKKAKNYFDALKYAYAFMSSTYLYKKECNFSNPTPTQINPLYVVPRDSVSTFFDESNLPSWDIFKNVEQNLEFSCVGAIDELDKCRLNCSFVDGSIISACYGDYEKLAKDAMESIIKKPVKI